MKVLAISNDPPIFDAASAVRGRLRAYAALIGELHVISAAPAGAVEAHEGPLHLYPVTASRFWRWRALTRLARRLVKENGIELITAQDPFEHGRIAGKVAKGNGVPLHLQVHTDFLAPAFAAESYKNRIRVNIADKLLPQAHGIRVVSERVKRSLITRYGAHIPEPSVIAIAAATDSVEPVALPPHDFTFTLISLGRLEEEKRIGDLLLALQAVVKVYPRTGLFILNDGRQKERLMQRARELGLDANAIFLGTRPDARGLMRSVNAFVQTSAYEGYGVALIEAALAELPIVSTDVGLVGEVLMPNQDLLVVPVGDVGAIATQIEQLIQDNDLRRALKLHAAATARAHLAETADQPARIAADFSATLKRALALQKP